MIEEVAVTINEHVRQEEKVRNSSKGERERRREKEEEEEEEE